jgi:hypothetical protein
VGYATRRTLPSAALCYSPSTLNIKPIINEEVRADHTGRMVLASSIVHATGSEWDTTFALEPSGTSGGATPSDAAAFFTVGMFGSASALPNSSLTSGAGTALSANVSNISGWTSAMAVAIETSASTGKYKIRKIVSVSTSAGSGTVAFFPAVSSVPSGSRLKPLRCHKLDNTISNTSLSMWAWGTETTRWNWGAVPNTINVSWGNNTHPMASLAGFARGYGQMSPTTLGSAITVASGTTIDMGVHQRVEEGAIVKIDSEVLRLKTKTAANTYSSPTSARGLYGTVATSHTATTVVSAYKPTPTLAGKQVRSPTVCVDVTNTTSASILTVEGTEGALAMGDGIVPEEELYCDEWTTPGYGKSDGDLMPEVSLTGYLNKRDFAAYAYAKGPANSKGVAIQFGNTPGTMQGFLMLNALPMMFEDSQGDGKGSVGVTLKYQGRGTRAALDAIYYVEG